MAQAGERLLKCPGCSAETDSLKVYTISTAVIIPPARRVTRQSVTACPRCMRRAVRRAAGASLLGTHIFFPLMAPYYVVLWLVTYIRGHSHEVLEMLREEDKRQAVLDSIKGDGSMLDKAKKALAAGDRDTAFKIAKEGAALSGNDPADEYTKLMYRIYRNQI